MKTLNDTDVLVVSVFSILCDPALDDAAKADELKSIFEQHENIAEELNEEYFIAGNVRAELLKLATGNKSFYLFLYYNSRLSLLQLAAQFELINSATVLIAHGAKSDKSGVNQSSPLHVAAENGNVNLINTLLQTNGLNLNCLNKDSLTPLHAAARRGHVACMAALIRHGADVNNINVQRKYVEIWATFEKVFRSALDFCVIKKCAEGVYALLEAGAQPDLHVEYILPKSDAKNIVTRYQELENRFNKLLSYLEEKKEEKGSKSSARRAHLHDLLAQYAKLFDTMHKAADPFKQSATVSVSFEQEIQKREDLFGHSSKIKKGYLDLFREFFSYLLSHETPIRMRDFYISHSVKILSDVPTAKIAWAEVAVAPPSQFFASIHKVKAVEAASAAPIETQVSGIALAEELLTLNAPDVSRRPSH